MNVGRNRVTLVCNLSEVETLRFRKLMDQYPVDLDAAQISEAIYRSLEVLLPGEDVRSKFNGELVAIYQDRDGKYDRWTRPEYPVDA